MELRQGNTWDDANYDGAHLSDKNYWKWLVSIDMRDADDFIQAIEAYYDRTYVNEFELQVLREYLRTKVDPVYYTILFDRVTSIHPTTSGILPDKAMYAAILSANVVVKAELMWSEFKKYDDGHSILVTDLMAQAAIENLGGWIRFCDYRSINFKSLRRDFIEVYKNLTAGNITVKQRILLSHGATNNRRIDYRWFKIIGDRKKGEAILQEAICNTRGIDSTQKANDETQDLGTVKADPMTDMQGVTQ